MENGFDLFLVLMEPYGAPYFSSSCMISLTQVGFLFRDMSIVRRARGPSMSWSSDASISGEGATYTFLGGTSSSSTSSCRHFLYFLRVVSSSNVTSLLIYIWWNPEGFRDFRVSNKYSLLSRRVQLGYIFFWNENIYWTTKYLEMAHFNLIFYVHFF